MCVSLFVEHADICDSRIYLICIKCSFNSFKNQNVKLIKLLIYCHYRHNTSCDMKEIMHKYSNLSRIYNHTLCSSKSTQINIP